MLLETQLFCKYSFLYIFYIRIFEIFILPCIDQCGDLFFRVVGDGEPFPVIYHLPKFPDVVQEKLRIKDKSAFAPGTKCKTMLIDCLFDDMRKRNVL